MPPCRSPVIICERQVLASGRSRCAAPGCATGGLQREAVDKIDVSPRRSLPSYLRRALALARAGGHLKRRLTFKALAALLTDAPGPASKRGASKDVWQGELARSGTRPNNHGGYLHWAERDSISSLRMEQRTMNARLVIIGMATSGAVLAIADGYREAPSRGARLSLLDLRRPRGGDHELAVGRRSARLPMDAAREPQLRRAIDRTAARLWGTGNPSEQVA